MKRSELRNYIKETILNKLDEAALNEKTVVVKDADEANAVDAGPDDTVVVSKKSTDMNEASKKKA
jgi:hypothetical protein